jgi:hypothetical protein
VCVRYASIACDGCTTACAHVRTYGAAHTATRNICAMLLSSFLHVNSDYSSYITKNMASAVCPCSGPCVRVRACYAPLGMPLRPAVPARAYQNECSPSPSALDAHLHTSFSSLFGTQYFTVNSAQCSAVGSTEQFLDRVITACIDISDPLYLFQSYRRESEDI